MINVIRQRAGHETLDTNAKKQAGSATTKVEANEPQRMQQRGLQAKEGSRETGAKRSLVEGVTG